jgi:hypothetical protein
MAIYRHVETKNATVPARSLVIREVREKKKRYAVAVDV